VLNESYLHHPKFVGATKINDQETRLIHYLRL
jgi:hypothetical protein